MRNAIPAKTPLSVTMTRIASRPHPPVGMWFNYGVLNYFMKEWVLRKEELKSGKITRDEYFEWKINWPQTCDGCGKYDPKKKWRSVKSELSET